MPGFSSVTARCLLLLSLWSAPALARDRDPPAYTEAVDLGVSEFDAENYTEARAHFARAHALYPNARTLRALGMVAFELKRYAECARYLEEALASSERRLEGDKRAHTEKLMERANGYLARYNLDIPPSATVVVDGNPTTLAAGDELVLEAGDHVLEFRAPGHITSRRPLTVQGAERDTLHVALARVEPADKQIARGPASGAPSEDKRPGGRPVYKNPWLWTALGVVVAGAAATTAVLLTRDGPTTRTEAPYTGTGGAPALETPR